jgi:aspartate 1-decarboxylase
MLKTLLQAKLHRVHVTEADLHYEGSCAVDQKLLDAAGLCEFQYVEIYNVTNGNRWSTYLIKARRGSGTISVNGAGARLAAVTDLLIIAAYSQYSESEIETYAPTIVKVGPRNRTFTVRKIYRPLKKTTRRRSKKKTTRDHRGRQRTARIRQRPDSGSLRRRQA